MSAKISLDKISKINVRIITMQNGTIILSTLLFAHCLNENVSFLKYDNVKPQPLKIKNKCTVVPAKSWMMCATEQKNDMGLLWGMKRSQ